MVTMKQCEPHDRRYGPGSESRPSLHRVVRARIQAEALPDLRHPGTVSLDLLPAVACLALGPLFAIGLTGAHAREPDPDPPDPVSVFFDWPVGFEARVSVRTIEVLSDGKTEESRESDTGFTLRVSEHPDGRLISHSKFRVEGEAEGAKFPGDLTALLDRMVTDFAVANDGTLVEVVGQEKARQAVLEQLRTMPGYDAAVEVFLEQLITDEVLATAASREWSVLVPDWLGRRYVQGETVEESGPRPLYMFDQTVASHDLAFEFVADTTCIRGGEARRCVELVLTSRADPEAAGQAIAESMRARAGLVVDPEAPPSIEIQDVDIRNEIRLLAEPAGLIPHRLEIRRSSRATIAEDGWAQTGEQRTHRVMTFEYGG